MSRSEMVPCRTCNGEGKVYWNFGHSSGTCITCGGHGYVRLEEYIEDEGRGLGYSGNMLKAYVDDYFQRNPY